MTMKYLKLVLLLSISSFAQQTNTDFFPATQGLNLGHANQRWNVYVQNLDISGTCLINGIPCGTGTGGGGTGVGCGVNPSDNGCALAGTPSVDFFIGLVGAGTGFLAQLLSNKFTLNVPLNIAGSNAGVVSLGCSTDPGTGSGIAIVAPATCTPWNLYLSQTAGTGFMMASAVGNKVTQSFQAAIDLTANVGISILPIANGGTNNSTASGALVNLFPTPTRNGDSCCFWNGSAWANLAGNNSGTGFMVENGVGVASFVASPVPPTNGGTGLATLIQNTIYKGNATSAMLPSSIVDNGTVVAVSEPIQPTLTYLTSGTASSQTNECSAITHDSSGGSAVTAVAVWRTIISSVGHDVACVVTADATNPGDIGSLIFPSIVAFSTNSAASQISAGTLELLNAAGGLLAFTNNGGTTRTNSINFRACNSAFGSCGTDVQIIEDSTGTGKEDLRINMQGDGIPFYIGNYLNSAHPGIWLGGSNADSGAVWGIDRVAGSSSHIGRLAADTDAWGTVTLSSGTFAFTFNRAFASAPICFATWQGVGTLTGFVKCVTTTTGFTITSSGGTDTAVMAYQILGNNN
jgi:hypothetical protein